MTDSSSKQDSLGSSASLRLVCLLSFEYLPVTKSNLEPPVRERVPLSSKLLSGVYCFSGPWQGPRIFIRTSIHTVFINTYIVLLSYRFLVFRLHVKIHLPVDACLHNFCLLPLPLFAQSPPVSSLNPCLLSLPLFAPFPLFAPNCKW